MHNNSGDDGPGYPGNQNFRERVRKWKLRKLVTNALHALETMHANEPFSDSQGINWRISSSSGQSFADSIKAKLLDQVREWGRPGCQGGPPLGRPSCMCMSRPVVCKQTRVLSTAEPRSLTASRTGPIIPSRWILCIIRVGNPRSPSTSKRIRGGKFPPCRVQRLEATLGNEDFVVLVLI